MNEDKIMELQIEGLTEEEVKEVSDIFQRFIDRYKENPDDTSYEWLKEQLQEELPDRGEEDIQDIADEIVEAIREYDEDLEDLNQNCRNGITKESWLADKLQDSAKGVAINTMGDYLYQIDSAFEEANRQMQSIIYNVDVEQLEPIKMPGGLYSFSYNPGERNQCQNLDGFIAEQYHVNSFNAKAVLEKSPYRARVCKPEGSVYTKNSIDVMIDNVKSGQKGVARYQFKFGKDSSSTIQLLKRGNYDNQRIVVPEGQVEQVQQAFPNKSVTDYIGGTEDIPVKSDPMTKEMAKKFQIEAQEQGLTPKINWNSYKTREVALNIGKQAGMAGIQAAFMGMGIHLVSKSLNGECIESDEVIETALKTGSDTCVKAAASGALKVASEKGMLQELLPPGTPAGTIAKIACVGVENVKILLKVAKGELTMSEALEQMGRTSVSMWAGLGSATMGAGIGAAALAEIPVVGPLVGGIVGGMVGYVAGSSVGEKVYDVGKKVVKKGIETVKKVGGKVKEGFRKLKDIIFS
ncbi:hypothetical protein [Faecalicatena contorta]|uniref:hypothetical protein n=1 Tax=Faecalicatena contorta TaxID=39482 RepID=UPI001F25D6BF|nr:hypothetical protein [Faecalicatena contorta]MCF2554378.1 hypothetical protein [Faecalicatena contorta]